MKKIIKKVNNEQASYYDEAHSLFITGSEIEQIAEKLPVSLSILKKWQKDGLWERKKELRAEHPKLMGEALKGLVKQKVKNILNSENQIDISNVEELTKIINLIERLEDHSWDERAAVVEVMSLFSRYARREVRDQKKLQFLTKLMEKFFEVIERS